MVGFTKPPHVKRSRVIVMMRLRIIDTANLASIVAITYHAGLMDKPPHLFDDVMGPTLDFSTTKPTGLTPPVQTDYLVMTV
jgi:hypothetical protein